MVDGFLLFTVVDVWRVVLPLGLTFVVLMTEILNKQYRWRAYEGLADVLSSLAFCLTFSLMIISAIIGLVVPSLLGHSLPESHIAVGPWGYEEMWGYAAGALCLRQCRQRNDSRMNSRLAWMGGAAVVFSGIGILWVGRWDAMAHGGNVPEGWFMVKWSLLDWTRLVPKVLHLFFSSLTAGGCLVALLGVTGWFRAAPGSTFPSQSPSSLEITRYGVGWMLSGLVPQILIGPWLFLVLDESPRVGLIDGFGFVSAIFL